jgi:hypothetical protein
MSTKIEETKKQERWFRTDVNFENSFKFWFALNWQNKNIQLFVVFFTLLILQLANFKTILGWLMESYDEGIGTGLFVTPFMFIPLIGTFLLAYKGMYQHFDDLKNGTSR